IFALKIIEQEVEMAHTRLTSAKKAIELYRAGILPQLEQNLTIIEDAYQLGEVGIIAPIEEQKKFLDVSEKYLMALYNWNTAVAKVEAATGLELKKEYGEN
ncbi:MAG: TolC family protein, partial [Desulfobulbaceae bacterium]|nr:TolC family protein [Desulfobulbaceae bacterium]